MALKIRLRQQGRRNRAFYRMVVADGRAPRNGKYVEMIGWYDPCQEDNSKNINVNVERVQHWLQCGAQMTTKVESLVKRAHPTFIQEYNKNKSEKKKKKTATPSQS